MIYEPREDSYLIEKEVAKIAKGKKVLDMGAGSGIQGKAALKAGAASVIFADINQLAVDSLRAAGLDAVKTDLFAKISGKFDLIVFNPPYLPEDEREDAESALATSGGKDGDELACAFLSSAKKHLGKDGQILLLLSSLTPMSRINSICQQQGFSMVKLSTEKLQFEELHVFLLKTKRF
jgi:release factor glutamine methyltransferase